MIVAMSVVALSEGTSATEFGEEMGDGWSAGVRELYGNESFGRTCVNIYRNNGQTAGDIDFMFAFTDCRQFRLNRILPKGNVSIKPMESGQTYLTKPLASAVVVEIKRSASEQHLHTNIEAFVNFYHRTLGGEFKASKDENVRTVLAERNLVIIYAYNHADPNTVENALRVQIRETCGVAAANNMTIRNRKVFALWIPHQNLTGWQEKIVSDRELRRQAGVIEEQQRLLREKEQELQAQKRLIDDLLANQAGAGGSTKRARHH